MDLSSERPKDAYNWLNFDYLQHVFHTYNFKKSYFIALVLHLPYVQNSMSFLGLEVLKVQCSCLCHTFHLIINFKIYIHSFIAGFGF